MNSVELCWVLINNCIRLGAIDYIRIAATSIWFYVFCQSFPGLKALLFKTKDELTTDDRNDAWVAAVALSIMFFSLRWYVNVDSDSLFTGLYVFSIMVALARIFTYKSDRCIVKEAG